MPRCAVNTFVFWQENNKIEDDSMVLLNNKRVKDPTGELCRVILQNVYEPPVPEAVVAIDMLQPDINYEDVMDKVTAAMSADTLVVEVGEKTAMRRRVLNLMPGSSFANSNSIRHTRIFTGT